ncbi:MAG: recombinase family protein [Patescibacteria group bacterium]
MEKKVAVAYCRVSTEEQANKGLSLDVQEENCVRAIKENNMCLLKVIRDEGKSAGSLKRSGMEEIMRLSIAKKIDAIYVISSDRLTRNTADHLLLRDMFRKNDVQLIYLNQPLDDSAISRTMDTILASFNEFQRMATSEKVKSTMKAKAEAGYFPTLAPIGYKNTQDKSAKERLGVNIITPDEMAPLVTELFKLYATGNFNVYDLGDLLYKKGLRTKRGEKIAPSRLYDMLKNRVYLGEIVWGGMHIKDGKHPPLIDEGTFSAVQSMLSSHSHHACRRRKYSWLLNGFLFCPDHGRRFTAEWHLDKKLAYYHCSNKHGCGRYIEASKMEEMVSDKFNDIQFTDEFIEIVTEKTKRIFYRSKKEYERQRQGFINRKTALEAKRTSAENKLFENIISDEDFSRIRKEINKEIDIIEGSLSELAERYEIQVDICQEIMQFMRDIRSAYESASPTLKRHYLAFFWERFEVLDGVIIKSVPSLLVRELLKEKQIYLKKENPQLSGNSLMFSEVILNSSLGA